MMNWEIIGYIGAICTTFCFLPQVIKAVKTKELDDFSWIYLFVLCIGISLWIIYGLAIRNMVIIIANTITLLFVLSLLIMKKYYKKKNIL